MARALLLAVVLGAQAALAAACCMSSSVLGVGRLAIWESASAGSALAFGHTTGRADALRAWHPLEAGTLEDEVRLDAWGIVRLAETVELNARVPWVVGVRTGGDGATSVGTGVGDVALGARWDVLRLGDWAELPGVALLVGGTAPSGRRPEDATDALGASSTGRGAWQLSAGLAVEKAVLPWFLRLDGAFTYSFAFRRADTGALQQIGPAVQAGLSGGYEVLSDKLVLAAALRFDHEWELLNAGARVPNSAASSFSAALSGSYKVTSHWTVTASASTDLPGRVGVAQNRPERLGFTAGVRYGFF
jgi:hypothetical protein